MSRASLDLPNDHAIQLRGPQGGVVWYHHTSRLEGFVSWNRLLDSGKGPAGSVALMGDQIS